MTPPNVSIIIPLYNRAELILETLQSLVNQSYPHWEAVIVDDQSTDNSYEVVKKAAEKDKRIRVYQRNLLPKGAPKCRNIGIEKANGEYVIFLDSDDMLAPYCLQERITEFEKHKEHDYLVFNGAFFENVIGDSNLLWNIFSEENDLNRFLRTDTVWQTSAPIWRHDSLMKYDHKFMESAKSSQDWEFHVKALIKKMSYDKIDGLPDYFIRRNVLQAINAISSGHSNFDNLLNRIQLYNKIVDDFEFTEGQCDLLFDTINKEVFNSYRNFSLKQLKILWLNIQEIDCFKLGNYNYHQHWYVFLSISSKLTFHKSHQLLYYYKRYRAKNKKNRGYRSLMSNDMYNQLNKKLNTYKSIAFESKIIENNQLK